MSHFVLAASAHGGADDKVREEKSKRFVDKLTAHSAVVNPEVEIHKWSRLIAVALQVEDLELFSGATSNLLSVLQSLKAQRPEDYAVGSYWAALHLQGLARAAAGGVSASSFHMGGVAKTLKGLSSRIVADALLHDPRLMVAYSLLEEIADGSGGPQELYAFFTTFAEKYPNISVGHYLKGYYGLVLAQGMTRDELAPVVAGVQSAILALDRLEPGSAGAAWLKAHLVLLREGPARAIDTMGSVGGVERGRLGYAHYSFLASVYMMMGRYDQALEQFTKLCQLDFHEGREHIFEFLRHILRTFRVVKDEGAESPGGLTAALGKSGMLNFLESAADVIAEDTVLAHQARIIYGGLYALALFQNRDDAAGSLLKKAGTPLPVRAARIIDDLLQKAADVETSLSIPDLIQKYRGTEERTAAKFGKFTALLNPLPEYPGLAKTLVGVSKISIALGDRNRAVRFARKAFQSPAGVQYYFEHVAKDFFSACLAGGLSSETSRTMMLDAIEVSLLAGEGSGREMFAAEEGGLVSVYEKRAEMGFSKKEMVRMEGLLQKLREKMRGRK